MALESVLRIARTGELFGPCEAWVKDDYIVSGDREFLRNALEPLDEGLLIVEEFARLDVDDKEAIAAWVRRRGPFDFDLETFGHNARNVTGASRIKIEGPSEPVEFPPPMLGPHLPWHMLIERRSIEDLRERGWTIDPIDKIRIHHEQIRDWFPAIIDYKGQPYSWVLGAYLPDLVSDALAFRVDELPRPEPTTSPALWTVQVEWMSVLQPIYLQMFTAFRRAERGVPAGAYCRECGEPFLILDGRRSTYCNSKCRNRFNVRAFRERSKQETDG